MKPFDAIPADPPGRWLGNLLDVRRAGGLHEYLLDLHRRRGQTVRLALGSQHAVSTICPEALARLANSGFDERPSLMRPFMGWLGDGNIAFKSGKDSRRTRAQLIPLLTGGVLERICELGTEYTDDVLESIPHGEPVDALGALHAITLRTMGACCFGDDFARGPGADIGARFMRVLRENPLDVGSQIAPVWRPSYWSWCAQVRALHARVRDLIASRTQRRGSADGDLLERLLSAKGEDGSPFFSEAEARMAVLAFYFGGVDATAAAALWTMTVLALHPSLEQRAQAEVDEALLGMRPSVADFDRMPLLAAVVKESLRLYSPNPVNMRRLEAPRAIDGYDVPEGTVFFLAIAAIHQSESLWKDPQSFMPERFLDPGTPGGHRYAYIPFGIGAKSCIGARFASAEVQLMVARILQHHSVSCGPGASLASELRSGVLFPARNPQLVFTRRLHVMADDRICASGR